MNALKTEFDRALLAKAQTIAGLLEQDEIGLEFDFFAKTMPEFAIGSGEYFELWVAGWPTSRRAASLGAEHLPRLPGRATTTRLHDIRLREGQALRLLQMDFLPQLDPKEQLDPDTVTRPEATLVMGRSRETLDSQQHRLRVSIAGVLGVALLIVIFAVRDAVTRGLSPLRDLRAQLARLNAKALSSRVVLADNYVELAPLIAQTNQLLAELEHAFERERLFAVAAAHELKTPLAEIRSLAEVAARFVDDRNLASEYLNDIADSVARLDNLTERLLLLAELAREDSVKTLEAIDLAALISDVWDRHKTTRGARGLRLEGRTNLKIQGHRAFLELIFSNLIGNVVAHSADHTVTMVSCREEPRGRAFVEVTNPSSDLTDADVAHVFDQFWRKDPARRADGHLGLGLALVRSCSAALGLQCGAHLSDQRLFTVRIDGFRVVDHDLPSHQELPKSHGGGALHVTRPASEPS